MATFRVKLVSQTNAFALILILCIAFFIQASLFSPIHNKAFVFILTALDFIFAWRLWQIFVTGKAEFSVGPNEITIYWIKKFPLSKIGNIVLHWSEIEKVWQGFDPNYYNLKFRLTSGKIITFYHDNLVTKDDFEGLLKEIFQMFEERKKLKTIDNT